MTTQIRTVRAWDIIQAVRNSREDHAGSVKLKRFAENLGFDQDDLDQKISNSTTIDSMLFLRLFDKYNSQTKFALKLNNSFLSLYSAEDRGKPTGQFLQIGTGYIPYNGIAEDWVIEYHGQQDPIKFKTFHFTVKQVRDSLKGSGPYIKAGEFENSLLGIDDSTDDRIINRIFLRRALSVFKPSDKVEVRFLKGMFYVEIKVVDRGAEFRLIHGKNHYKKDKDKLGRMRRKAMALSLDHFHQLKNFATQTHREANHDQA